MVLDEASTGTTTINSDIKAYISRDNGTTYSQVTLTDDGEYATGKRMLSGSVDISGQPSGTSMRYKIETLNQSASKVTRIYGTALMW
jgi:flagellin-like hook-associated protein FlgL